MATFDQSLVAPLVVRGSYATIYSDLQCSTDGVGARSLDTIPADTAAEIEWVVQALTGARFIGFVLEDAAVTNYTTIRHGSYVTGSTFYVFESGGQNYNGPAVSIGDVIAVRRTAGGTVTYYINGVLKYTSPTTTTAAVEVGVSFFSAAYATAHFVTIKEGAGEHSPVTWDYVHPSITEVEVYGGALTGGPSVTKLRAYIQSVIAALSLSGRPAYIYNDLTTTISGVGARSAQVALAGQAVEIRRTALDTTGSTFVGIVDQGESVTGYEIMEFSLYLTGTLFYVFQNTSNVYSGGAYVAGDEFSLQRTAGGVVTAYKNDVLVYTSGAASTGDIEVGAAFFNGTAGTIHGALVSVGGGALEPVDWDVLAAGMTSTPVESVTLINLPSITTFVAAIADYLQSLSASASLAPGYVRSLARSLTSAIGLAATKARFVGTIAVEQALSAAIGTSAAIGQIRGYVASLSATMGLTGAISTALGYAKTMSTRLFVTTQGTYQNLTSSESGGSVYTAVARSDVIFPANSEIEAKIERSGQTNATIGFIRSSDTFTNYTHLRYQIHALNFGTFDRASAQQNGSISQLGATDYTDEADGDIYSVHRAVNGTITYRRNGVTFYTSAFNDTGALKIVGMVVDDTGTAYRPRYSEHGNADRAVKWDYTSADTVVTTDTGAAKGGSTIFRGLFKGITVGITVTGVLAAIRTIARSLSSAIGLTPALSTIAGIVVALVTSISMAPSYTRSVFKSIGGTVSFGVSQIKAMTRNWTTGVTGSAVMDASTVLKVAMSVAIGMSTSMVKGTNKVFAVAIGAASTFTRAITRSISTAISATGSFTRSIARSMAAAVDMGTSFSRQIGFILSSGISITASAVVLTAFLVVLGAGFTFAAAMSASRVVLRAMSAGISAAAGSVKQVGKSVAGSITAGSGLVRAITHSLPAYIAVTVTASMVRGLLASLSAAVDTSTSIARSLGKTISAAASATASFTRSISLTRSVNLAVTGAMDVINIALNVVMTAALSTASVYSFVQGFGLTMSAALGMDSTISRIRHRLMTITGSVGLVASFNRALSLALLATINLTSGFTRAITHSMTAASTATATIYKRFPVAMLAGITLAATISTSALEIIKKAGLAGRVRVGKALMAGKAQAGQLLMAAKAKLGDL